ncbi:hypothetical protein GEMRC1_003012 [Eukaryota sp. GEM-RC1]
MLTFNFQEICLELDNHCQLYGKQGVLFCDNASSHSLGSMELHFLKVIYLPPNTTTTLQPLDAGIIRSFKAKYRNLLLTNVIDEVEANNYENSHKAAEKINVLQAMNWSAEAWSNVSEVTIKNCWERVGIWSFVPQSQSDDGMFQVDGEIEELDSNIQKLNLDDGLSASDYCYPVFEREGGRAMSDDEIVDAMKVRWGLMASEEDEDEEDVITSPVEDEDDDVSSQEARICVMRVQRYLHRHPERDDITAPLKLSRQEQSNTVF